jgi:GT2 family glycosyltransferase
MRVLEMGLPGLGVVVIGRNEGARLVRCLDSIGSGSERVTYVDSGSTDSSVAAARDRRVDVHELDLSVPFTAARARNAGFRQLVSRCPEVEAVQFFDGDCEIDSGWLAAASEFMAQRPDVGIVYGVQRERFPRASIYNTLIDMEWDTPRGNALAATGNMLCRRALFEKLSGFREDLIAGEDPEFCLRARHSGSLVWHLDVPMVLHDADMHHFGQWWRRAKRGGYAFAEGAFLHGNGPEPHFVRETRSAMTWGFILPTVIAVMAAAISAWVLVGFLVYPLQVLRVGKMGRRGTRDNLAQAVFVVLAKFPEAAGVLKFRLNHWFSTQQRLIEYK